MTAHSSTGGTPATVALTREGVAFTLHPYEHRPHETAYGQEAVKALGLDSDRVFKTLVAEASGHSGTRTALVVAVVPVARQLDLKALASTVGAKKAAMADPAVAERSTGYVVGGISPLGQRTRLRTVVDISATTFTTIWLSAGKRGLQLELSPHDLIAVTDASVAAVAV